MSQPIAIMFQQEKQRILQRSQQCEELLRHTESALNNLVCLDKNYQSIAPKTTHLHSECKTIIQERDELKECYDKIESILSKQELNASPCRIQ